MVTRRIRKAANVPEKLITIKCFMDLKIIGKNPYAEIQFDRVWKEPLEREWQLPSILARDFKRQEARATIHRFQKVRI